MKKNIYKLLTEQARLVCLLLVFILPFAVVVYQLTSDIEVGIKFAQKEKLGLEYHQPLRELLEDVLQERQMLAALENNSSLRAELANQQLKIQHDIQLIDSAEQKLGSTLKTTLHWKALKANLQNLQDKDLSLPFQVHLKIHTEFIGDILSFILHVGDTSNLILDPALDSYYLMDIIVTKLPSIIAKTAQARELGTEVIGQKSMTPNDQAQLIVLSSLIKSPIEQVNRGIQVSFSKNISLKPKLESYAKEAFTITNQFLEVISQDLINPKSIDLISADYSIAGAKVLESQFQLYDVVLPALDQLLQTRINELSRKKAFVLIFTLLVQSLIIYVFIAFSCNLAKRRHAEKALQKTSALLRQQADKLEEALHELQQSQTQLVQTEKMSSLGQLVAGVAHEINNPVNFIYGNLTHAHEYTQELLQLIQLYTKHYPHPVDEIQSRKETVDLEFLLEDLPKLLSSMKLGAERIRQIVLSLRTFSRLDEAEMKPVDIHEGIDSTLLILDSRLKAKEESSTIQVIKEYGNLPQVECYAGQLNQVFMNILANAIDALEESSKYLVVGARKELSPLPKTHYSFPTIRIRTEVVNGDFVAIRIVDNGYGMTDEVRRRLFDPFFTTKPVGKGTGLGLSISYQIVVEKHGGILKCISAPSQGTEFVIEIPIYQGHRKTA